MRIVLFMIVLIISGCKKNTPALIQEKLVKVGAVSMEPTLRFSDLMAVKIQKVAPVLAEAGKLKLDMVVLPEFYFSYDQGHDKDALDMGSCSLMDSMKVFARRNHINILFHLVEKEGTNMFGTAVVINREGEYVGKYRKVNLPPEESDLTPGDSYKVFNMDFGKIGVLICWDSWFTDPAKILVDKGAEMIIVTTWCNYKQNMETIVAENGVPLVYSILKMDCGDGDHFIPSSVFDYHGDPVYEDFLAGQNRIAVGTVSLGVYQNLALHKSVTASAGESPEKVTDGLYSSERDAPPEMETSWSVNTLPQWIEIDLGKAYDIDRVSVVQFDGEDFIYKIEGRNEERKYMILSDSVTKYETVLEHGIAGSEILTARFEKKKVQYVKLTLSSTKKKKASIHEIKVFAYK